MAVRRRKDNGALFYEFEVAGKRFRKVVGTTSEAEARRIERQAKIAAKEEMSVAAKATALNRSAPLLLADAFERYYNERTMGGSLIEDQKTANRAADVRQIKDGLNMMLGYFKGLVPPIRQLTEIDDSAVNRLVQWRSAQYRWGRPECGRVSPAMVNRSTIQVLRRVFVRARKKWKLLLANEPAWGGADGCLLREPMGPKRILRDAEEVSLLDALPIGYDKWQQFSVESCLRMKESLPTWQQYDAERRVLTVRIKGGDTISHPLSDAACELIESCRGDHPTAIFTYVAQRTRAMTRGGVMLKRLVAGQRYPITAGGLSSTFRSALGRAGITGYKLHDNRRTGLSDLARGPGGIRRAQKYARHASVTTTERYVVETEAELRQSLEAAGNGRRARVASAREQMAAQEQMLLPAPEPKRGRR